MFNKSDLNKLIELSENYWWFWWIQNQVQTGSSYVPLCTSAPDGGSSGLKLVCGVSVKPDGPHSY